MRKLSAFITLSLALVLFTSCASETAVSTTTEATVTTVAETTVADTSATEEAENLYPIPDYDKKSVYNDVFEKIEYGPSELESYAHIMYSVQNRYPQYSYYEVEIIKLLSRDEVKLLKGYYGNDGDLIPSFYRVNIIKDLILDEEINQTSVITIEGNADIQLYGYPPYAKGDRVALALKPRRQNEEFMIGGPNYILGADIYTSNDTEIGLIRYHRISNLSSKELVLDESERSFLTTTRKNPVIYTQKFLLSDLVDFSVRIGLKRAM